VVDIITSSDWTGIFIGLCFGVFILFWTVTAFSTKRTVQRKGRWFLPYVLLSLAVVMLIRAGRGHLDWLRYELWPHTLVTGLVADVVTLAGLLFTLWARVTLGRNWSGYVVLKEDHELITGGPYRYVRHPIYSVLLLMFLGWGIWGGHVRDLVGPVLVLALLWVKARAEEQLMVEHFGDRYREYRGRVKALVPYVL